MQRIGLFGGSFDPVHLGHLLVAQSAMEELALARLYFIPAAQSPFKPDSHPAVGAERSSRGKAKELLELVSTRQQSGRELDATVEKLAHCHLKIFSATTKLTTNQKTRIAIGIQLDVSDVPSFIKARSTLLSAVSGRI